VQQLCKQQALLVHQEHQGLLQLRLLFLDMLEDNFSYVRLAVAGQQWDQAVSRMLQFGDR
jgi:hypothetical protein